MMTDMMNVPISKMTMIFALRHFDQLFQKTNLKQLNTYRLLIIHFTSFGFGMLRKITIGTLQIQST